MHGVRSKVEFSGPGYHSVNESNLVELSLVAERLEHPPERGWQELDYTFNPVGEPYPEGVVVLKFYFGDIPVHCHSNVSIPWNELIVGISHAGVRGGSAGVLPRSRYGWCYVMLGQKNG